MENKKVLLCNWINREESLGGQETFFYELSKILNAKRISYSSCENVLKLSKEFNFAIAGQPSVYRAYVMENYLDRYENLFNLDLIIKNSGVGGFMELKTPQIIVFQDPFYSIQKFFIERETFFGDFYNASIEMQRRTAKQGKTVAVSNFMKRDMELCDIKCDKVIEEGIDIEKFKPVENKEELKKFHGLPLDKKIGISVTKFITQKGWDILAKLINKFPDIHWVIILTGKIGSKPKLKNVTLVEQVNPEIMPRFYQVSDFYISTSPVESFNLSACESLACELPIITYKTGIFWDWFDEKIGYRVDDWNYESFEKAVEKMNNSDLSKFSSRQTLINRKLTKDEMSKNWKNFIANLLNNK